MTGRMKMQVQKNQVRLSKGAKCKYGKGKYKINMQRWKMQVRTNQVETLEQHRQMAQPSMDRAAKQTLQNTEKHVNWH